jgi:hypothetical protein
MSFEIRPVRSKHDLKLFIHFVYWLYKDDQEWVAPLRTEEKKKFSPKTNPMLLHCESGLFLLLQNGRPVGRIAAFIDKLAVEQWGDIGLFGLFECIDNTEASCLLLDAARNWLREKKMSKMRGPWGFTSQEWGMVINGFNSPMIMAPYNFPYYNAQMEMCGLKKVKDLFVYEISNFNGYEFPARILKLTNEITRKNGICVRPADMGNFEKDVRTIVDLANQAIRPLWGFVPTTDEEALDMARSLKMVVDPDIILIAEAAGKPVGFMVALPDINLLLKRRNGRLFPVTIFKLLFGIRKIRNYRVWAFGIIPDYQGKAIDILFYQHLYQVFARKKANKVEANFTLEDNMAINNPLLKLGFQHSKTYRVYEADI